MSARERDPFAAAARPGGVRDDPFVAARVAEGASVRVERTDTLLGPLARRDPEAPTGTSSLVVEEPVSIDDLLRSARRDGFLTGLAVGALAVAGAVAALSWALLR